MKRKLGGGLAGLALAAARVRPSGKPAPASKAGRRSGKGQPDLP